MLRRNGLLLLLSVASNWAVFGAVWWVSSRLSTPCRVLLFLAAVLFDLIRNTGERNRPDQIRRPVTLAGPLQPWQRPTVHDRAPVLDYEDYEDYEDFYAPMTGIWNPELVRPLLDDTKEDTHG